jgi:hypothetical protein
MMKVQLIKKDLDGIEYQDLTLGNTYWVIGIEANDYRIINDEGQPYLYSPDLFSILDATEPEDWITTYGEDGERYAYPPQLNSVGFFEDYFDGDAKIIAIFRQYLAQQRPMRGKMPKAA